MIYKISVPKDDKDKQKSVWCKFDFLNFDLEFNSGTPSDISIHANFDMDEPEFEENDIDFYFILDENPKCLDYARFFSLTPIDKLPEGLFFLCGKYNGEVKKFY